MNPKQLWQALTFSVAFSTLEALSPRVILLPEVGARSALPPKKYPTQRPSGTNNDRATYVTGQQYEFHLLSYMHLCYAVGVASPKSPNIIRPKCGTGSKSRTIADRTTASGTAACPQKHVRDARTTTQFRDQQNHVRSACTITRPLGANNLTQRAAKTRPQSQGHSACKIRSL